VNTFGAPNPIRAILSLTLIAALFGFLVWVKSYIGAGVAAAYLLIILWDLPRHLAPGRDESEVLRILDGLGGSCSVEALDAKLEEVSDAAGNYRVERLEDLKEALVRLEHRGTLRVSGGTVSAAV
jgi:hypothetical protein